MICPRDPAYPPELLNVVFEVTSFSPKQPSCRVLAQTAAWGTLPVFWGHLAATQIPRFDSQQEVLFSLYSWQTDLQAVCCT